ncbi:short-chain dehydrogenase/reductase family 9C member 7-like [Mercenaria mercenaria]|uniref:short-chain dehydrogenase/reductase family 9C member 7-like n=1 Tax=Mercenaria mercenaria TaxID=6596 RepID=UPI00234EAB59|nr:short-chain dehydrogenase/reductase family 9C member 7-like [Mercenaria mercenaria]
MCPVLAIIPVLITILLCFGINWYFRRKCIQADDRAVFITGCDRGFGETLACKLALEGYEVYAGCLDLASDGAKRLQNYSKVTVLQLDVTDDKSVEGAKQTLFQHLSEKGLWAVVNNAGVAVFAETEWCSMDEYNKVIGVNLMGTIRVTKACLPLIRRAQGRVITISSLAGRLALPGFTAYSASKFGLIGFSDSLRREMWKFGVKVISIEPKLYRTAISDGDFHVQTNQKMWSETDENVRVDYGDTYFRAFLEKMLSNLQLSSRRTYQVIDDLMHATTAQYPYTRYVPGLKMQLMSDPFVIQPNCVLDYCVHSRLNVPCVPFSMRKKKSA